MGSTTPVVKPSPDSNSPMMMLPDPAVGIIDLATLKDIHRFLNQSGLQDDRELAAWVQQNFLYEPITPVGREIRTTESFSQLDRAYRRARSLTNKTQDKWPFFSRDWKEMPPATVRNNARGEAAPGVALPGMTGAMHDSPMSDSQPTQTCDKYSTPTPFVPFGTSKPTRHDPHRARRQKSFATAVPHTPVPLPSTKQGPRELRSKADFSSATPGIRSGGAQMQTEARSTEALSEHPDSAPIDTQAGVDPGSTASVEAGTVKAHSEQPTDISTNAPATPVTAHSLDIGHNSTDNATLDPDGGKVRGRNGRFMPKETSGRPKRISKAKPARKSNVTKRRESVVADSIGSTTPAPLDPDHDTMAAALLTPESVEQDEPMVQDGIGAPATTESHDIPLDNISPALATEGEINVSIENPDSKTMNGDFQDAPSPQDMLKNTAMEMRSELSSSPYSDLPLGYILAAESDPVFSNLDKLPLGSRLKRKRKAEAAALEGPRRKRGRPLKEEQVALQEGNGTEANAADQSLTAPGVDVTVTQDAPRMSTRRTTRKSAAAKVEETAPVEPALEQPSSEKQVEHGEDKTMVDVDDEVASAGHETPSPVPEPVEAPPARLTRAKAATSDENPSKLNLFALDDEPKEAKSEGSFALGLLKTGFDLKQSEVKRKVKTPSKPAHEPAATPQSASGNTKVEFFARVESPKGKVEVPMTENDLDEVGMIKKYAEWMEKEGMEITYHAFKSIYGLAKEV